ncbi:MAG: PilZ domain-containing protein [Oligoflexales bacterium]
MFLQSLFKKKSNDNELSTILTTLNLMTKYARQREKSYLSGDLESETRKRLERQEASRGVRDHKRLKFDAEVKIMSKEGTIVGQARDISASGIFVTTKDKAFAVDQKVELEIIPRGSARSYHAIASVIRCAENKPFGYGLRFATL